MNIGKIIEKIDKYLVNEGINDFLSYGKDILIFKKPLEIQEEMNKKLDDGKMTMELFLKSTKKISYLLKKDINKVKNNQEVSDFIKYVIKINELFYKKMSKRSDEDFYEIIMDVGKEVIHEMG